MFFAWKSPVCARTHKPCLVAVLERRNVLGFRSVITTPQRSRTSFSFLSSKSLSDLLFAVPVGISASLTES